jgi:3-hydroxyisobutyrate dehydrogenase-like beta-hydroxyacid dehydrogenase
MRFINDSVMGSTFSRYKTPAFVNLDFTPTFTGHLLRKDLKLGLDAGSNLGVPLPLASLVHEIVTGLVGQGLGDLDFAALIEVEARSAGLALRSEARDVDDGLNAPGE